MATNNYTAQSVVLDLLSYIGVTGFGAPDVDQALNQPGLDTSDTRRAIAAINSGLQAIQRYAPQSMKGSKSQRGALYAGPTTLIVNIVHGARTCVASTVPPAAIKGCTILIDGDGNINRVAALPSGNNITLVRPYLGATNVAAGITIYYDCATLDADVQAVEKPVFGNPGRIELIKAEDLQQFEQLRQLGWVQEWPNGYIGTVESVANRIGTPALYLVEAQRDGTVLLRVTPIPPSDFNVTFTPKLRAERITIAVVDETGATDPNYYFMLHDDQVESVLLPIARYRFFTHPALKNAESRGAVKAEYDEVYAALTNGQTLEPETASSAAEYI